MPTNSNYWHFELQWLDLDDDEKIVNPREDRAARKLPKSLLSLIRASLVELFELGVPETYQSVGEATYKEI
jgi:hypothetical protein